MGRWMGKVFFTQLICFVIFQLITAWLWHVVRYTWGFGLVLFIIEGILLPIGISWFMFWKTISTHIPQSRKRIVYWSLSVLYLISFMVGEYVYMIFSGYQSVYRDWGGGVTQLEAVGEWIIASLVLRQAMRYFELDSYRKNS
ncbi:hypothetical protein [Alicyclobacillus dauci]|uniref:Uncharacterized protein n=1 Tax=Alicyclobacillus dauci TaxID=1475485 RepID=A0ABY6Z1V4_9BACL|nr:hypothetical protein [Alicyclobacillus dauci]WAH35960.1 hypothetical protein NZD86_17060 [Alicyclobacillus dauci]